jgi:hypothetical protein
LFPTESTTAWDGQASGTFIFWFCELGDNISSYLVAKIQGSMKQKVLQKFIELSSHHSAIISLLEVWNYYGHWIPLHVNLHKNMPYLFHYCAFDHINIVPETTTNKKFFPKMYTVTHLLLSGHFSTWPSGVTRSSATPLITRTTSKRKTSKKGPDQSMAIM